MDAANRPVPQPHLRLLPPEAIVSQEEVDRLRHALEMTRSYYATYYSAFRFRLAERLFQLLKRLPFAVPSLSFGVHQVQRVLAWWPRWRRSVLPAAFLDRLLFFDPPMHWLFKAEIRNALKDYLLQELHELRRKPIDPDVSKWFQRYRPSRSRLARFRSRKWPSYTPVFSVVVRVCDVPAACLAETLRSVREQVYWAWEALCIVEEKIAEPVRQTLQSFAAAQDRFRVIGHAPGGAEGFRRALAEARGDYICLLDAGDALEPQTLYRLADAALDTRPDLLYSDSVSTGLDLDEIRQVHARPDFSYDYCLSYPYISHLLALRTCRLQEIEDCGSWGRMGQEQELLFRVLECSRTVVHIPELLYLRRLSCLRAASGTPQIPLEPVRDHLRRLGLAADVSVGTSGWRDVRFERRGGRVAVIIPTHNRHDLLRRCLETVLATTAHELLDICVIDHRSDEPETKAYLRQIADRCLVLPYEEPFNYSRMMNHAVARLVGSPAYYLFLNNDIEPSAPGWLEHMLGHAQRSDVGIVGPLLLYPSGLVQHAGAVVGLHYAADHSPKSNDAEALEPVSRAVTHLPLATRDVSAVTGACMLMRSEVFHQVGGFDGRLAVGFGDTDLCLRVRARGYKVLFDAGAVLLHHESATRGRHDPHPLDTQFFRARYLQFILCGDPFYSPLLSRARGHELNPHARAPGHLNVPTVPLVLPEREGLTTLQFNLRREAV
jgi:GT2 family glycosyltransferase